MSLTSPLPSTRAVGAGNEFVDMKQKMMETPTSPTKSPISGFATMLRSKSKRNPSSRRMSLPAARVTSPIPTSPQPRRKSGLTDRSEVNHEIAKEIKIRDGCKTMLKAIPKTKEHAEQRHEVKAQLSRANSNISGLHLELQKINGNLRNSLARMSLTEDGMMVTNEEDQSNIFPVIAVPLKECTKIDMHNCFSNFVVEHYHEKEHMYRDETLGIDTLRERMREAPLSVTGRNAILDYYAHLLQAEHRFFQEDRCKELSFQWFDSFDGLPATSRSVRLEKASVLFNLAAMCSQLAAICECNTVKGLEQAIEHFQNAAGIFQYIREERFFNNSPSTDIARSSASALSILMLAQAQECIWHVHVLQGKNAEPTKRPEGAEAAAVADWYMSCREAITDPLQLSFPKQWMATLEVKEKLFRGIADWHAGSADMVHPSKSKSIGGLAKVLRASQTLFEANMYCKRERIENFLQQMVMEYYEVVELVLARVNPTIIEELRPKIERLGPVHGKAVQWATGNCDLIQEWTQKPDMFARMGPVYFFNSMCALVERREHTLEWKEISKAYGLRISGGNPVRVSDVAFESPAQEAGVLAGDYLISINDVDVRCKVAADIESMLAEFHKEEKDLVVSVVVNYDMQNFEELINPEVPKSVHSVTKMLPMPISWTSRKFELSGKKDNGPTPPIDC
eukprot:m.28923 g.28923  ORF g.28923 m.28923 type:complete len:680 (+) comp8045_c0_seq1:94-2133(+)